MQDIAAIKFRYPESGQLFRGQNIVLPLLPVPVKVEPGIEPFQGHVELEADLALLGRDVENLQQADVDVNDGRRHPAGHHMFLIARAALHHVAQLFVGAVLARHYLHGHRGVLGGEVAVAPVVQGQTSAVVAVELVVGAKCETELFGIGHANCALLVIEYGPLMRA